MLNTNNEITNNFGVKSTELLNSNEETKNRVDFLKNYIKKTKMSGLVLGISGGVDSTLAGRLCQLACEELRAENYTAHFIAVRLPYGIQADEKDAQAALDFINPDYVKTVNIKEATDAIHNQVTDTNENSDFRKGNVKARMRMIAQYDIAAATNSLVVGTDHAAELVMGFYTKWGDGACDITPLGGLNKRQVRFMAQDLGAPEHLWNKVATADLEDDKPGVPDEVALGVSYDDIDDLLEGHEIDPVVFHKIMAQFEKTRHKRNHPVSF